MTLPRLWCALTPPCADDVFACRMYVLLTFVFASLLFYDCSSFTVCFVCCRRACLGHRSGGHPKYPYPCIIILKATLVQVHSVVVEGAVLQGSGPPMEDSELAPVE